MEGNKLVERLKELEEERDLMLEGLEKLGWPVMLYELPSYCLTLTNYIERLEKKLEELGCPL